MGENGEEDQKDGISIVDKTETGEKEMLIFLCDDGGQRREEGKIVACPIKWVCCIIITKSQDHVEEN